MYSYELTLILRNRDVDALKTKVRDILQKHGAVITEDAPWGSKRMAYEVEGERDGYYDFFHLDAPGNAVQKIIADFRLNADILRFLFVKVEKKTA